MTADYEPVSPITMEDYIDIERRVSGAPEITEAGTESHLNGEHFKTEHASFDAPQPRQTKSWRTRLVGAGRAPTVNVTEVHKNGKNFPELEAFTVTSCPLSVLTAL
jgi:hypothetical protein